MATEPNPQCDDDFQTAVLASLAAQIVVLDRGGNILMVNPAWVSFAQKTLGASVEGGGVGTNYLRVCRDAKGKDAEFARRVGDGIEAILNGDSDDFSIEYPCHCEHRRCWFLLQAKPLKTRSGGAVVSHTDITDRKLIELALLESQSKLAAALASMNDSVLIADAEGNFAEINDAFASFYRFANKGECEHNLSRFAELLEVSTLDGKPVPPERWPVQRAVRGEVGMNAEHLLRRKDTGESWIGSCSFAPIRNPSGTIMGAVVVGRDVTRRTKMEHELAEREARLSAVLNTAADAIITIDSFGKIESVNAAATAMFGYSADELVGANVKLLMPEPYREEHDGYLARYRRTREKHIIGIGRELTAQRKDGTVFPIDLAVSEVDHLNLFTGVIRDISLRKELQQQVLRTADEEQRRIGQELHDGIVQELTGLALFAATLAELLDRVPLRDEHDLARIKQTARKLSNGIVETNRHVQQLSHGIMPIHIDPEALRSALAELATATNEHRHVVCWFDCAEQFALPDDGTATQLYRIAQEAVNNALKHSRADAIRISLTKNRNVITLEVSDNGIGFDVAAANRDVGKGPRHGFGLGIMRHRAGLIGGTLNVFCPATGGTTVKCTVIREKSA